MLPHDPDEKKLIDKQSSDSELGSPDRPVSHLPVEGSTDGTVLPAEGNSAALQAALDECTSLREKLSAQTQDLELATLRADQLEQDLLQFVSSTSHDLSRPLRAISGFSTLLSQEPYESKSRDDYKKYLDRILAGTKRLKVLIDSISQYALSSTIKFSLNQVDLNEVLDQVLRDLDEKIQQSDAVVTRENLSTVLADKVQLSYLMRQLIENSISFCDANRPEVIVSAERVVNHWLITVRDNGRGMTSEQIESAFVMFRRFDYDNVDEGGTGAGLTICKQIVQRHNGTISIASELGVGTTVTVSIIADGTDIKQPTD